MLIQLVAGPKFELLGIGTKDIRCALLAGDVEFSIGQNRRAPEFLIIESVLPDFLTGCQIKTLHDAVFVCHEDMVTQDDARSDPLWDLAGDLPQPFGLGDVPLTSQVETDSRTRVSAHRNSDPVADQG